MLAPVETSWVFAFVASTGYIMAVVSAMFYWQLLAAKNQIIAANEKTFHLMMVVKDAEVLEQNSMKVSYKDIAEEAVKSSIATTDYYIGKYEGRAPLIILPDVVPESHSPSTALQREQSDIATLRAKMAQVKKAVGQEPRPEPPHAIEKEKP